MSTTMVILIYSMVIMMDIHAWVSIYGESDTHVRMDIHAWVSLYVKSDMDIRSDIHA